MWSYALAAVGITGLTLAVNRPRAGWILNLAAQILWVVYALSTRQWGFLPMSAAYTVAYLRLLRRAWTVPERPVSDVAVNPGSAPAG